MNWFKQGKLETSASGKYIHNPGHVNLEIEIHKKIMN